MSNDQVVQMRDFIFAAEELARATEIATDEAEQADGTATVLTEDAAGFRIEPEGSIVLDDLHEVVFRLRAFEDATAGDYGLGVETGMQRAADMIENLIRRHAEGV